MRQYQIKETKEVSKIICNKCGKEVSVENGHSEEEMFHVEHAWGYFSGKDGEKHSFDLCEACYDEIVNSFCIPVEIEG